MNSKAIYILIRRELFDRSNVVGVYDSWCLANKMAQADRAAQATVNMFAKDFRYDIERQLVENN
jgi:hypothetical protein